MKKEKRGIQLPHVITLIFMLIVLVAIMTWIIPSGTFERTLVDTAAGEREVAVAGTYSVVEKVTEDGDLRQGIQQILQAPGKGIQAGIEVIAFVFIISGASMRCFAKESDTNNEPNKSYDNYDCCMAECFYFLFLRNDAGILSGSSGKSSDHISEEDLRNANGTCGKDGKTDVSFST